MYAFEQTYQDDIQEQLRFERNVTILWECGPRTLAEFLSALGAEYKIRTGIDIKLEQFAALSPDFLRALRADQFPPRILEGDVMGNVILLFKTARYDRSFGALQLAARIHDVESSTESLLLLNLAKREHMAQFREMERA